MNRPRYWWRVQGDEKIDALRTAVAEALAVTDEVREAAETVSAAIEGVGDVRAAHLVDAEQIALLARYVLGRGEG